ncbi:MAG: cation:proton antiporter subunit C [Thermostichus sp. BF3_bins_97]
MLNAAIIITIILGFLGVVVKRNLIMKIIAMDVMSTGVIAFFVIWAARNGMFTPIYKPWRDLAYADPVLQGVILTAIVIGLSVQALMLVGVMKLARNHPTLEVESIEQALTQATPDD